MTNTTTPIEAAFEMQRESIKQTQQLFEKGLELQQNVLETFMYNGINAGRSAQTQGAELLQQLANAQLDAVESAVDEDRIRSAMNEQLEQNSRHTQQLLNAQYEQGAQLFQQLVDAQFEAFESAVDEDEYRSAMNGQFYDFEASQERAWDEFESGFVEAFDELSEQQKRVVARSVGTFLDAQENAEQQTIQGVQQAEAVQQQGQQTAEVIQTQTEQAARAAGEATEEAVESAEETTEEIAESTEAVTEEIAGSAEEAADTNGRDGSALEAIEGLGETYADRLHSYGIESIEQLSQANSETVADVADISESRANEWITNAQSQA